MKYTEQEFEKEVQLRVEFKMNEFLTALKNRVNFKWQQAFDMTRESEQAWKSFKEISEMMQKEIKMSVPYDDMAKRKKWEAKEKAVDYITETLKLRGSTDYSHKIKSIVNAIETAQDWQSNEP